MGVSGTAKSRPRAEFSTAEWSEAEQWWANHEDSGRFLDLWKNGTLTMAPSEYVPTIEELRAWEESPAFAVGETKHFGDEGLGINIHNFDDYMHEAQGRQSNSYNWGMGYSRYVNEVEIPRLDHEKLVSDYLASGDPLLDPTPDTELTAEDQVLMLQRSGLQAEETRIAEAEAKAEAEAEAEAEAAAEAEATRIADAKIELDDLWGIRTTAEAEAEKFVNDYYLGEMQAGSLHGTQIDISEQAQFDLISQKFSELWSPEAQARFEELTGEFGLPGDIRYARTDDLTNLKRLSETLSPSQGTALTDPVKQALSNSTILTRSGLLSYEDDEDLEGLLG